MFVLVLNLTRKGDAASWSSMPIKLKAALGKFQLHWTFCHDPKNFKFCLWFVIASKKPFSTVEINYIRCGFLKKSSENKNQQKGFRKYIICMIEGVPQHIIQFCLFTIYKYNFISHLSIHVFLPTPQNLIQFLQCYALQRICSEYNHREPIRWKVCWGEAVSLIQ